MPGVQPLHVQLYEAMLQRIRTGAWAQGERLPSEKELTAEFGTSRAPVRQALAALRAEGVISGGRGAPPRVQRIVPSQSFASFMSFTEWARGLGRTPGQRVIEAARRSPTEPDAGELGIDPDEPVVELLRLRLLDGEPAMLERSTYPWPVGRHLLTADLDAGSSYQHLRERGIAPVRARHVIDAVGADEVDARWLGIDDGQPLLRVRRLAYDERSTPIEAADDRYLPGMTTFVIENTAANRSPLTRAPAIAEPAASDTTPCPN